jgi:hypothetical protein
MQKPPPNPTHPTTRRQAILPNPFHPFTGVEHVRFVGYSWNSLNWETRHSDSVKIAKIGFVSFGTMQLGTFRKKSEAQTEIPFHPITGIPGVDRVDYVGCKWSFYPPTPPLRPQLSINLSVKFMKDSYRPGLGLPHYPRQLSEVLQGVTL